MEEFNRWQEAVLHNRELLAFNVPYECWQRILRSPALAVEDVRRAASTCQFLRVVTRTLPRRRGASLAERQMIGHCCPTVAPLLLNLFVGVWATCVFCDRTMQPPSEEDGATAEGSEDATAEGSENEGSEDATEEGSEDEDALHAFDEIGDNEYVRMFCEHVMCKQCYLNAWAAPRRIETQGANFKLQSTWCPVCRCTVGWSCKSADGNGEYCEKLTGIEVPPLPSPKLKVTLSHETVRTVAVTHDAMCTKWIAFHARMRKLIARARDETHDGARAAIRERLDAMWEVVTAACKRLNVAVDPTNPWMKPWKPKRFICKLTSQELKHMCGCK